MPGNMRLRCEQGTNACEAHTLRKCLRCRLVKCIDVGMRSNLFDPVLKRLKRVLSLTAAEEADNNQQRTTAAAIDAVKQLKPSRKSTAGAGGGEGGGGGGGGGGEGVTTALAAGGNTCRVCGEQSSIVFRYFGAMSCKPCANFFRKRASSGIQPSDLVCVVGSGSGSGSGECDLTNGKRVNCAACRYRRCVNMGMRMSGVKIEDDAKSRGAEELGGEEEDGEVAGDDHNYAHTKSEPTLALSSASPSNNQLIVSSASLAAAAKCYICDCPSRLSRMFDGHLCSACLEFVRFHADRANGMRILSVPCTGTGNLDCDLIGNNRRNCRRCRYERYERMRTSCTTSNNNTTTTQSNVTIAGAGECEKKSESVNGSFQVNAGESCAERLASALNRSQSFTVPSTRRRQLDKSTDSLERFDISMEDTRKCIFRC